MTQDNIIKSYNSVSLLPQIRPNLMLKTIYPNHLLINVGVFIQLEPF